MHDKEIFLPQELYTNRLKTINNINFTRREIDILACRLNRRDKRKEIASFLSISENTVRTHLKNISTKIEGRPLLDFLESSSQHGLLKKHYVILQVFAAFEKSLKEIGKLKEGRKLNYLIVHWQNDPHPLLVQQLESDLRLLGISVSKELRRMQQYFSEIVSEVPEEDGVIYIASNAFIKKLQKEQNIPIAPASNKHFFIFPQRTSSQKSFKEVKGIPFIDLTEYKNYYFGFFDLLQYLFPTRNFDKIKAEFNQKYVALRDSDIFIAPSPPPEPEKMPLLKRFSLAVIALMGIGVGSVGAVYWISIPKDDFSVRSDLTLPADSARLDRPELLAQINHHLKEQTGIKTVALVGPGGAGKTTLARQYAHQQKGIVWEINAETIENLRASLWNFAHALAKAELAKEQLREIEDIKNISEKDEKLLQFIKDGLQVHPHWTLVFDNVEKPTDFYKFFPADFKTWGEGKILITTRNSHIQNSKLIHSTLPIEELNPQQKLALFTKIMEKGNKTTPNNLADTKVVQQFLEKIPSYPLDVSIAAYYLKTNNMSLQEYLDLIDRYNNTFVDSQEEILKEVGDYIKTRYSIISLSLEQLMKLHPDDANLLLFISLLDSQNIPQAFLHKYKNTSDVKNFINELKRYSLLTNELSLSSSFDSTLSLHRSTQAIILAYFVKTLGLEETKTRIQPISHALEQVVAQELGKENTVHLKMILNHLKVFLSHDQLLDASTKSSLTFEFGRIYGYLSQYEKAKELLEQSLEVLQNKVGEDIKVAQISTYLGNIYKELAKPEKSQELLEKSLTIYNKNPEEHQGEIARALAYLGDTYKNKGDLIKAKSLLEQSIRLYKKQTSLDSLGIACALIKLGSTQRELRHIDDAIASLEESLSLYKAYSPENFMGIATVLYYLGPAYASRGDYQRAQAALEESIGLFKKYSYKSNVLIGRALVHLGNVYRELGEYEHAKNVLEQAFAIHKIHHTKEYSQYAWSLLHLGFVDRELGEPQKAKLILEECLETYRKHFDKDNIRIAWILAQLAKVHNDLHNYSLAIKLLEQSLPIHEKTYGQENIETARVVRTLAQAYLLKGDLHTAETHFKKILTIFQESKHPDVYKACEDLADLEFKKARTEESQGNRQQAEDHKTQATHYLTQALEVVKTTFPENSPHLLRIQEKLTRLR